MPTPALVLLGPRGSGKTTLGRLVADRLHLPFADLDDLVQQQAGQTIARIFQIEGQTGFRQREAAALQAIISSHSGVISTGGGVIVTPGNRASLAKLPCPRVLLLASPEVLHARITADPATAALRPALTQHGGVDEIRHLLMERLGLYREVATHELDASAPVAELVGQLIHIKRARPTEEA